MLHASLLASSQKHLTSLSPSPPPMDSSSARKPRHESDTSSFSWTSDDDDAPPPSHTKSPSSSSAAIPAASDEKFASSDDVQEDVDALLEALPREQLVSLLLSSAARNAAVRRRIRLEADVDPANCKIVVRNLPWRTTSHALHAFFSQFGLVTDCHVAVDCSTGLSKGFGFVHFSDPESAARALHFPDKCIGNRVATCLLVPPRDTYLNDEHVRNVPRKIYVARVEPEMDADRLHKFFSKYGEIEEGPIGFNKFTGKFKGYAMFVYKTDEGARRALEEPMKNFEGHLLQCQAGIAGKVKWGFRQGNCCVNAGAGPGDGFDLRAPPGFEQRQFSCLKY